MPTFEQLLIQRLGEMQFEVLRAQAIIQEMQRQKIEAGEEPPAAPAEATEAE